MRPFIDPNDPFFRRPVTRWAAFLVPIAWAALEAWFGNFGWAAAMSALGAYAGYVLIFIGPKP